MAVLAKETCNFKEPTSHSHSIAMSANPLPSALSMPCHTWVGDRGRNIKRIHYAPRRSAVVYARWYAQEFLKSRLVTQLHIENLYGAGFWEILHTPRWSYRLCPMVFTGISEKSSCYSIGYRKSLWSWLLRNLCTPNRSAIVYARWYPQEFLKSYLVTQLNTENLYEAGFWEICVHQGGALSCMPDGFHMNFSKVMMSLNCIYTKSLYETTFEKCYLYMYSRFSVLRFQFRCVARARRANLPWWRHERDDARCVAVCCSVLQCAAVCCSVF